VLGSVRRASIRPSLARSPVVTTSRDSPAGEQADPIGTLRTAMTVARAHGKKVLFTPAVYLVLTSGCGT
jgi:hypothetical protein